jgi:hypothetical protein
MAASSFSLLTALVNHVDLLHLLIRYLTNSELLELRKVTVIVWRKTQNSEFWIRLAGFSVEEANSIGSADLRSFRALCLTQRILKIESLLRQDLKSRGLRLRKHPEWNSYQLLNKSVKNNTVELFLHLQIRRSRILLKEELLIQMRRYQCNHFPPLLWLHLTKGQRHRVWQRLPALAIVHLPWAKEEQQVLAFRRRRFELRNKALKEVVTWASRWKLDLLLDHLIEVLSQKILFYDQFLLVALIRAGYYSRFDKELLRLQGDLVGVIYKLTKSKYADSLTYLIQTYFNLSYSNLL